MRVFRIDVPHAMRGDLRKQVVLGKDIAKALRERCVYKGIKVADKVSNNVTYDKHIIISYTTAAVREELHGLLASGNYGPVTYIVRAGEGETKHKAG